MRKERMSRLRHSGREEVYSLNEAKGSLFTHLATIAEASDSFTQYCVYNFRNAD
jgi:hypothetical protein